MAAKALILGATGLAGQAIAGKAVERGFDARTAARRGADLDLDVTDSKALHAALEREQPALIVNCAALVDVGACECDPGLAYRVNASPVAQIARWCETADAKLVHVSTDHFFAGEGAYAHDENAPVTLFNQYAATKYAAEQFALLSPEALVLRTSVIGIRGWEQPSFAEWAIGAVLANREMTLFADAFTSSIDVVAFADAAFELVKANVSGRVNLAAREVYSKEAFIRQIAVELNVTITKAATGSVGKLEPPRPKSLGLDVSRATSLLGRPLPDLNEVVQAIVAAHRSKP